jgi:hypothetical protein
MITIDTLVAYYGSPFFVKIDVEGFEESVLDGLSIQPPLVSFEYNRAYPEATMGCLDKPVFGDRSVFNVALGDPVAFELSTWVGKNQFKEALNKIEKGHGDVFVRPLPL